MTILPRKKPAAEIDTSLLKEPLLSDGDWVDYKRGWQLFNKHQFWEAHEAWEAVWRRRPEESRIFFQGIIQLAAAYHLLLIKPRFGGMMRNLDKAEEKLRLFPDCFLRVDVSALLRAIHNARAEADRLGPSRLEEFADELVPTVQLRPRPI